MIALIVFAAYVVSGLLLARHLYPRIRPLTIPASCERPTLHARQEYDVPGHDRHYDSCYQQPGIGKWLIGKSQGEAVAIALLLGLFWPFVGLCLGMRWVVVSGNDRQRPAELENHIADLERQLGIRQ